MVLAALMLAIEERQTETATQAERDVLPKADSAAIAERGCKEFPLQRQNDSPIRDQR